MAIILTLISMSLSCGEDLLEKFCIDPDGDGVAKTIIWNGLCEGLFFVIFYLTGLSESGLTPVGMIINNPYLVLPAVITVPITAFSLVAYRYVGIPERNVFANIDGVFYIVLLVLFYLLTGKAEFAAELFSPLVITGLILIFTATFIYPNLNRNQGSQVGSEDSGSRKMMIIGIAFAIVSAFFDGLESVSSSLLIGDHMVKTWDYLIVWGFFNLVVAVAVWLFLLIRDRKPYIPFRKSEKYRFISQLLCACADILYVFALTEDALLGVILWNSFPVLDIIGARIFMKEEKLSIKQYAVLLTLVLGVILISLP